MGRTISVARNADTASANARCDACFLGRARLIRDVHLHVLDLAAHSAVSDNDRWSSLGVRGYCFGLDRSSVRSDKSLIAQSLRRLFALPSVLFPPLQTAA